MENDDKTTLTEQGTEATSPSRMDEGAIPKEWRPGCGCLCFLVPYYLFGLTLIDNLQWEHDWMAILAYVFGPFFWPVFAGGWMPHPVLGIPVALVAVFAYWRCLRRAMKADERKDIFRYLLWILLLFLLSLGGCFAGFSRSFDGVC